jgi:CheY-like chemotaxis protein
VSKRKRVILCVDDEELALTVRKLMLEQRGYMVLAATTAEQALELFSSHHVDLVLADHLLSNSTFGTALASEMRGRKAGIPIAIYSGVTDVPADLDEQDFFISKLDSPEELFAEIEKILSLPNGAKKAASGAS